MIKYLKIIKLQPIMKYVIIILNCNIPKHLHTANIQRNTWLKNEPNYYHIIGDPSKCGDNKYIIDQPNKMIYTNTGDDYNSLPAKVITAFLAVQETMDVDYIFKTDDNQMLQKPYEIKGLCKLLNKNIDYGGLVVKMNTHVSGLFTTHPEFPKNIILEGCAYCTGPFYILSNNALNNVLEKYEDICKRVVEDHAIGFYLEPKYSKNVFAFDTRKIFKEFT